MSHLLVFVVILATLLQNSSGQGNGNPLALRQTPFNEVYPIPNFLPPFYIKDRILKFTQYFFEEPEDQAAAEEILMAIWYFRPVYKMLTMMDKMDRHQYTYAGYNEECVGDSEGNEKLALQIQEAMEAQMQKPDIIRVDDYFFELDAWWEIVGNTISNLWIKNEQIAGKVCDYRRASLMCMKNAKGDLRCGCGKAEHGVQMTATFGGICSIQKGKRCDYATGSRLMHEVFEMEVYNRNQNGAKFKTCFGNSYCTAEDPSKNDNSKCVCWNIMTSEVRAKRSVLLNLTVGGDRCDTVVEQKILKWPKWFVVLSMLFVSGPLVLILAPHWDDFFCRRIPAWKDYLYNEKEGDKPANLPQETYDVKMDPAVKKFIEENSVVLDIDDPDYFDKVDAVDEKVLSPFEYFVTAPHCNDRHYHFEWPTVEKLQVWF